MIEIKPKCSARWGDKAALRLAEMIADRNPAIFDHVTGVADRDRVAEFWAPHRLAIHRSPDYTKAAHYQAIYDSQIDMTSDNGSRRAPYLEAYCEPLFARFGNRTLKVLHPACGCGHWIDVLSARYDMLYFGVDHNEAVISKLLMTYKSAGLHFIHDDLSNLPDDDFDVAILDYEILNALDADMARDLVDRCRLRLRPCGVLFGDIRLSSSDPDRMKGRTRRTYVVQQGEHIDVEETGTIAVDRFGWQSLRLKLQGDARVELARDCIRLICWSDLPTLFRFGTWLNIHFDRIDHIDTDKPECSENLRFLLTK